jgi:hypothetical protein
MTRLAAKWASLLSSGEHQSESIRALLSGWRARRGSIERVFDYEEANGTSNPNM